MEKKRKQMMLSLSEEMHASLMRFAKATGVPAVSFVYEVLEQAKPDIDRLSEIAEQANTGSKKTAAGVLMAMLDSKGKEIDDMKTEVKEKSKSGVPAGKREAATPDETGLEKAAQG